MESMQTFNKCFLLFRFMLSLGQEEAFEYESKISIDSQNWLHQCTSLNTTTG